jgi:hypothetical protein
MLDSPSNRKPRSSSGKSFIVVVDEENPGHGRSLFIKQAFRSSLRAARLLEELGHRHEHDPGPRKHEALRGRAEKRSSREGPAEGF